MLVSERPPERVNPEFDTEASMKEALARLPVERMLEQYGVTPIGGSWKRVECPFCHKKTSAGVFDSNSGMRLFKCHSTSCPSGTKAMGPVELIAEFSHLSRKDAFISYLKQANVWRERTRFKSAEHKPDLQESGSGVERHAGAKVNTGCPGPEEAKAGVAESEPPQEFTHEPQASAPPVLSAPAGLETAGSQVVPDVRLTAGADQSHPELTATEPTPDAALAGASIAEAAPSKLPEAEAPTAEGPAAAKVVDMSGRPVAASEDKEEEEADADTDPEEGWRGLRAFYSRLTLTQDDEAKLFAARGLESRTVRALGYRSSIRENRQMLEELEQELGFDEMRAAGLWLPADRKNKKERRPNSQYCGMGVLGKKSKGEEQEVHGTEPADFIWGWCYPILIPYFDERGRLISLRPHKGMGRAGTIVGTPQVYVPREIGPTREESFQTVVITEGEFKAAAVWQTLGAGRQDGRPAIGVCALPGISFGRNYEVREVLDDWLRRVKCRRVVVAFDNEEKGDPNLESYKPDPRKRFDAQIWARFLATDVAQKLHIHGEVCVLPAAWRNSKGKADWDGALAEIVKEKAKQHGVLENRKRARG